MATKKRAAKKPAKRATRRSMGAAMLDPLNIDRAAKVVKKMAIARGCYKAADKLIAEMLAAGAKHGDTFTVGERRYRLTDNFRAAKGGKLFRTTAFVQWSLDHDGEAAE